MKIWLKNLRWYDFPNYLLNRATVGNHATVAQDVAYATEARQVLDIYSPKQPRADKAIILFTHGGSWQHGNKQDYIFLAQNLAKYGFYIAVMNYRLAPEHIYPDFVEDTIQAINYLSAEQSAALYGYCNKNIVVMGHSAGAFNVMAALYHGEHLAHQITALAQIKAVIGIAGPYSFEHRDDPVAKDAFAQNVAPEYIMPSYFAFKNDVRHLLLVASKDNLVGIENAEKMQQALVAVGNQVELVQIKHTTHVSIIASLAQGLEHLFMTQKVVLDFLK